MTWGWYHVWCLVAKCLHSSKYQESYTNCSWEETRWNKKFLLNSACTVTPSSQSGLRDNTKMYSYTMNCEGIKRTKHYSHAGTPEGGRWSDNIPYIPSRAPTGKKSTSIGQLVLLMLWVHKSLQNIERRKIVRWREAKGNLLCMSLAFSFSKTTITLTILSGLCRPFNAY